MVEFFWIPDHNFPRVNRFSSYKRQKWYNAGRWWTFQIRASKSKVIFLRTNDQKNIVWCFILRRASCCLQSLRKLGLWSNCFNFSTLPSLFFRAGTFSNTFVCVFSFTGALKDKVWSLHLCDLFLASATARSLHDHVSLCRQTPPQLRGDCHPALCQA